jgi:phosphomevalonate kinase
MSKRKRRQRKAGRKVYYQRWSKIDAQKNQSIYSMMGGKQRFNSEENQAQRARREAHMQDAILNTFGLKRGIGETREEVLKQHQHLMDLEGLDRHMVVKRSFKSILILFYNKEETSWWFVERNPQTGEIRRSIDYDTREQAWMFYEIDRINFI